MKKFFLSAFLATAFLFPTNGFAAGYGEAGCGLGSLIFGDSEGPVQLFAATTNGTSYNQFFGITSGTSNCDASGIILASRAQEIFVEENFDSLAKEMAKGQGENLTTLAGLMGRQPGQTEKVGTVSQKKFDEIFKSENATPGEVLHALKENLLKDSELSASCSNIVI
ncbi:MAG: DUF3015 domain-containing protein [Nitrospinota bacterium]